MRNFKIGSLMGIPIRINITLLFFLPVLVWLIGGDIATEQGAGIWVNVISAVSPHDLAVASLRGGATPWLLGVAAAVGLFVGVTVHELGHSWVARRNDLEISSITLWIFGGMAQMEDNPDDWRVEFWMALAGPVTSVLVGVFFFGVLQLLPSSLDKVIFVSGWLAVMNVSLAVFNMIPAFPMDGGRILRSLLARNRGYADATQVAAEVGKLFAIGMGILGLLGNPILILIALFVYVAATSESKMTVMSELLKDVKVSDLMTTEVNTVTPDTTVAELTDRMLNERHTGYPVVDETGDVVGIVALADVKEVDEVERDAMLVKDIMTDDVVTVSPGDDAFEVLKTLSQNSFGRVVVEENDEMVGILSRTDLMTALDVLQNGGGFRDRSIPNV